MKDKHIVSTIAMMEEELTGEKKSEDAIYKYLQIVEELPDEVKTKIGNVSNFGVGHAIQLLRLKDKPDKQLELVEEFLESVAKGKPMLFALAVTTTYFARKSRIYGGKSLREPN